MTEPYGVGTVTVANGGTVVTGIGTFWVGKVRKNDLFTDPAQGLFARVTADPTENDELAINGWPGTDLVDAEYEIISTYIAVDTASRTRELLLGLSLVDPNYDVQVNTLPDKAAYDDKPGPTPTTRGYAVLVSDIGDGSSAIYSKKSNATADWSDPAPYSGPTGAKGWSPQIVAEDDGERRVFKLAGYVGGEGAAPTENIGQYLKADGAWTATIGDAVDFRGEGFVFVPGGYDDEFAYPKGGVARQAGSSWIALQPTTGNAPPTLPTTSNAYWELMAERGTDGDIDGVTAFWQSRILIDADAAAARAGLELSKQASPTDATAGALLTVGAFGVGKTVVLATPDLDSVRPSGRYYCSSPTNGPGGGNGWLDVFDLDADHAYHEFTNLAGVVHSRSRSGGVWSIWQPRSEMYLHVREEQAQNVAGGAAVVGANNRTLNAVKFNNIPGASVASSVITLPEGVYKVDIKSPGYAIDAFKIALLDSSSAAIYLEGLNAFSWATTPSAATFAELTGVLTIPSGGRTMIVRLYASVAKAVNGLGVPVNRTGFIEIYTDVMIKRIR